MIFSNNKYKGVPKMSSRIHDYSPILIRRWSYRLIMVCAVVIAGAIMLTTGSVSAQLAGQAAGALQSPPHKSMGGLFQPGKLDLPGDNPLARSEGQPQPKGKEDAPGQLHNPHEGWHFVASPNVSTDLNQLYG